MKPSKILITREDESTNTVDINIDDLVYALELANPKMLDANSLYWEFCKNSDYYLSVLNDNVVEWTTINMTELLDDLKEVLEYKYEQHIV